jgi:Mg2+ and Co2+ transporter CorA
VTLSQQSPSHSSSTSPADLLRADLWQSESEPTPLDPTSAGFNGGIAWFDVKSEGDTDQLFAYLAPRCQGLTVEMLEDLLEPDRRPQGEEWGDGHFRLASTFAVYPTATKNDRGDWACPVPSADLLYQPVELLSNGDWLITCWHGAETYSGWDMVGESGPATRCGEVRRGVVKRWLEKPAKTAADLGVLVMHELALTYAPAHRQLYAALEEWELSLYGDVSGGLTDYEAEPERLRDLWRARARLLDWLNPLNVAGLRQDLSKAWLPATDLDEVSQVDDRVDKALAALSRLGESLRSSFHSLQLKTAEAQRDRNEQRQQKLEFWAAIFLIPTFVVGFYGANTWVPGEQRQWGFCVMLAVILGLTTLGLRVISRDHGGLPGWPRRRRTSEDPQPDPKATQ